MTCQKCEKIGEEEMSENPLELISTITEFNDIHEFMKDEQLDRALHLVVKLIMERGKLTPQQAALLIVELQALATKFAIEATFYTGIGKDGTKEAHKKNVYFTMKEAINKLVDALKYVSRL